MQMKKLVEINHLTKQFNELYALDDLSINLAPGKIIGLLGPNGSGKTTLIKILTGIINKYDGEVLIDGEKVGIHSKSVISYLPDCNYLSEKWNGEKAVEFFSDFYQDFDAKKAYDLMHKLKINPKKRFSYLSKGTKEKLQLILVLSRKAKFYIFDEPIAGVDPAARDFVFNLILQNYNPEATILLSTHLISEVQPLLNQAIFLKEGKIILFDDVTSIVEKNQKSLDELFREVFKC